MGYFPCQEVQNLSLQHVILALKGLSNPCCAGQNAVQLEFIGSNKTLGLASQTKSLNRTVFPRGNRSKKQRSVRHERWGQLPFQKTCFSWNGENIDKPSLFGGPFHLVFTRFFENNPQKIHDFCEVKDPSVAKLLRKFYWHLASKKIGGLPKSTSISRISEVCAWRGNSPSPWRGAPVIDGTVGG